MAILKVEELYYDYILKSGVTHALNGVSAEFEVGKLYALTGRSGSGKTTLISLIAAYDKPKSGAIYLNGVSVNKFSPSKFRRENIGMVFQSYNLIHHYTALENVMLAFEGKKLSEKEKRQRAGEILASVGIVEKLYGKRPLTLSGGEQQRIAVARAIATDAPIVLADEPTGNLDNQNSSNIIELLKELAHKKGKCVIVVTHSEDIAKDADVRLAMSDGMIV